MEQIAIKHVAGIDRCRDQALLAVFKDHPTWEVYRAVYRYGEPILVDGRLQAPAATTLPTELDFGAGGLGSVPLGLITRNCAEIYDRIERDNKAAPGALLTHPLNMLGAGDLFGVFETADLIDGEKRSEVHWNISAGATSIGITANLGDSRLKAYFAKIIPGSDTWEFAERYSKLQEDAPSVVSLIDWHLSVRNHQDRLTNKKIPVRERWSTEVILFPPKWFTDRKLIERIRLPIFTTSHRQGEAARYLLGQRYTRSRLAAMSKSDSNRQIHLFDVLAGIGYFFEPVVDRGCELGPFLDCAQPLAKFLTDVVKRGRETCPPPAILQPVNLASCRDRGYISLRGWAYPGDRDIKPGDLDELAVDFTRSLRAIPELTRKLEAAALVFFPGGTQSPGNIPKHIFHHGQKDGEKWGKVSASTWGKLNLANERVETQLAGDSCMDVDHMLLKPVIKIVPRKHAF